MYQNNTIRSRADKNGPLIHEISTKNIVLHDHYVLSFLLTDRVI